MTSTVFPAADSGRRRGAPVAVENALSLAMRLEEVAGRRDSDVLHRAAALVRESAEELRSAGRDSEAVLRECMRLASDALDAADSILEAEAECWITLADLHDLRQEPTDFRGRGIACLIRAIPLYDDEEPDPGHAGWRLFAGRHRSDRTAWRAGLILRAATQLQAEGRAQEAGQYAEKARSLFAEAGEHGRAEECRRLSELVGRTPACPSPPPAPTQHAPALAQRVEAAPTQHAPAPTRRVDTAPTQRAPAAPSSRRAPRRAPLATVRSGTGPLDAIRDLRPLPYTEMDRADAARRREAGLVVPEGDRARFEEAGRLAQAALAQTEAGRHRDALLLYAMAQPLWAGIAGAELAGAACRYGLSTTCSALNMPIEACAAARTALRLVDAVPAAAPYRAACSSRVEDLRGVIAERYPRPEPAGRGSTTTAEMLLEVTERSFRLAQAGDLGADLDRDVLGRTIAMARSARFELEPAAAVFSGEQVRLARCLFIIGACLVLVAGHGHRIEGPVKADEAWASLLGAIVLAESGSGARVLRARCGSMMALMARLDFFADEARCSDALRESLDRYLAVPAPAARV